MWTKAYGESRVGTPQGKVAMSTASGALGQVTREN